MLKPELTKHLIAGKLKDLMKEMPLDKISVKDIADACGINRKTFYYHFKDKPELICWIFDSEFAFIKGPAENSVVDEIAEHLYSDKSFYIAALTSNVQNSLSRHLLKISNDAIVSRIKGLPGAEKISPGDVRIIANFFSNALIGSITQWAKDGMKVSPKETDKIFPIIDECFNFVINSYINQDKGTVHLS